MIRMLAFTRPDLQPLLCTMISFGLIQFLLLYSPHFSSFSSTVLLCRAIIEWVDIFETLFTVLAIPSNFCFSETAPVKAGIQSSVGRMNTAKNKGIRAQLSILKDLEETSFHRKAFNAKI